MPRLTISLLGPLHISIDGADAPPFDYAKVGALLVYLAIERGRPHSRDALAELLWPDQEPQVGRSSLRQALARLRSAIADQAAEPPHLLTTREAVQLNPASDHSIDAASFADLVAARPGHAHREAAACPECIERWGRAADLYRGPLADGPLPRDAGGYEEWLLVRREWYARQQLEILTRLADAHEAGLRPAASLDYARRALEIDPWREPAHRQVMRLLAAQGDRAAALAQYERCRRVLADELGVEPEDATIALCSAIRAGGAAHTPDAPRAVAEPTPPHLTTAPAPSSRPPAALPAQPTSFIGREGELRELEALSERPGCRLLTLLGPGGTGKTRLALRLAERIAGRFPDGATWVALAPLRSLDELSDALARALGAPVNDSGDLRARLREAVATRDMLLILDNLEHLIDGADLVAELLAAGPRLTIIATSRERLQLSAEWVYDLAGLSFPPPGFDDISCDAVRLLAERASQVGRARLETPAERAAAAQIARSVEGNPLALELAAAAARAQPFTAIAAAIETDLDLLRVTLRDVPERHRSVRATLEYSWRLLAPAERHALARLSMFRGGLSADAALAVAGADPALIDALADKSVLRRSGERIDLHGLLRRFAAEQLAAIGQTQATREAHLSWCVALAELAEPLLGGADQERWLERLEADHANIRAALAWAIDQGLAEQSQRISAALMRFWWMRGHLQEGRRWLERALSLEGGSTAARARALHGAGGIAGQLGDLPAARALMAESLELERIVGRKAELTRILNNLAFVYINQAEYERAEALIHEALDLDRELGDERGVAFDLGTLAQLAYFQADYARAVELYIPSLAGHMRVEDRHSIAVTHLNLGSALRLYGRAAEARLHLTQGLEQFRAIGSAYGISFSLLQIARLASAAGDMAQARAAVAECLPLLASLGTTGELAGTLSLAAQLTAEACGDQRSARLWGAAMLLLDERGASLQPPEMLEFGIQLAEARARADSEQWAIGWAASRTLTTEQAISEALDALAQAGTGA